MMDQIAALPAVARNDQKGLRHSLESRNPVFSDTSGILNFLRVCQKSALKIRHTVTDWKYWINYSNCQKYVPIDLANLLKVIASEAKQSLRFSKRLLRR